MTDLEIKDAIVDHNELVTRQFFFKDCKRLFMSIIRKIFPYEVDYDEFVNEFYIYLMEDDAYRMRQFDGRGSIYQWLKVTAIRYFTSQRDRMIDMQPKKTPTDKDPLTEEPEDDMNMNLASTDLDVLLSYMPTKRSAYVIRRILIDDAKPQDVAKELGVSVDNLYNIKKRAIDALTMIALKEIEKYEKETSK